MVGGREKMSRLVGTKKIPQKAPKTRITVAIPTSLDRKVELFCIIKGKEKNTLISEALEEYFKLHDDEILKMLKETLG